MSFMDTYGAEITELRKSLGLSQAEFAEVVGVTQSTVSRWEAGKGVSMRTVFAVRGMLAAAHEANAAA
jgi:transcriptional regulator with XRE-family HTH domain